MNERISGDLLARDLRFALVVSRFNDMITSRLRDAAVDSLLRHGCAAERITEVQVPGAFELPLTCKKLAASGRFDAIVALGCVIRGETAHFDLVCAEAARGVARAGLDHGVPVIFGVLTTQTLEQAFERAGVKGGNHGASAAQTAVEMANLMKKLQRLES
jgi:6,7-dimethyl-8-ribityllumazine synthase